MQIQKILAVAFAEMRSIRRLIRYWIFSLLSVGLSLVIYLYYSAIHGFASRFSATIGSTGPRFLISAMGIYLLGIFLVGLIFLAFDVRARDQRERMAEVLDSRPITNLELLTGRLIGLVGMAWIPFLFVAMVLQTMGFLSGLFNWWMGSMVEPYSLLGFIVFDGLTSLVLWCAVVILLAVTVRNRVLVSVLALALVASQLWILFRSPLYLLPSLSTVSGLGTLASDVLPLLISGPNLIQRLAVWILAAGFLVLAAAFHPRPDSGSKSKRLLAGGVLIAISLAAIATLAFRASSEVETRNTWTAAQEAQQDDPRPDLESLNGLVKINPGKELGLDLQMRVKAPVEANLETLVFSFNPGMRVDELLVNGSQGTFEHQLGLLTIDLNAPLAPGSALELELRASGIPDPLFSYLDSSRDLLTGTSWDAQIALLGSESSLFDRSYVALMPGVSWLPTPGAGVPIGIPSIRPSDFFDIDLEVEVPSGWLVAGPGLRQDASGSGGGERFRFHPNAPVPEVGLLASRFERRAVEVAGVELELLMNRKHMSNLAFFSDTSEALTARLEELLGDAEKLGLAYPYGGLSLVETPSHLRAYGGGWRMDTVQSLPAVMMLREHGFPTSRFEFEFRDPKSFEEREGGIEAAKLEALELFFENDFSGGNPYLGVSRNFLQYQTSASGDGALALDFVVGELVNQLLTGKGGYFSAHIFNATMGSVVGETITEMVSGNTDSVAAALLSAAADRPSVWDRALDVSLAGLDPTEKPDEVLNVLALKGRAVARSILDGLGREQTAALLAELKRRHRGGTFTAADLDAIATELGIELGPLVGDWLNDAALPGFLPSPVTVVRLADDDQGRPRYQTKLHVRNDEATPGLLSMRYGVGEIDRDSDWQKSDPIRIAANQTVEIGLLSSEPPSQLWLEPYLSLNRQNMRLDLPEANQEAEVNDEPFLGTRPSEWRSTSEESLEIIVDDLDDGFSVGSDNKEDGFRLSGGISEFFVPSGDLDQGLPEFQPFGGPPRGWSRAESATSWGKYRHTIAMVRAGKGDQQATFRAELPKTGRWRLDYYLPVLTTTSRSANTSGVTINAQVGLGGAKGTYDLKLVMGEPGDGGEETVLEFDSSVAEPGWNELGEFAVTDRVVQLVVSNKTSGRTVIADAIRWLPVGE